MRTAPPKPIVASGLAVVLLVNCPLKRTSEPGARFQTAFCTVTLTPDAKMFVPALLVSGPFKDSRFPFNVNPLLANASPLTDRLEMLLVLFGCVVPLKTRR